MKCWLNCSGTKWSNLKVNNKYLIKRRKLIEIPNSFNFFFSLSLARNYPTEPDIWYMQSHIPSMTVTDTKHFTGSSMSFHNKQLGNKPSI